jgi:hypothetical protein
LMIFNSELDAGAIRREASRTQPTGK